MRVVLDTNVWVSGLILPGSTPGLMLDAIRAGKIEAIASWQLAEEIAEVLRRPRLRRYGIEEADVRDVLFLLARSLPSVEMTIQVRDPDDAPVVEAAVTGRAVVIVTGDQNLLSDEDLPAWLTGRGIQVLTPAALLASL